jgi:hypothetical protein
VNVAWTKKKKTINFIKNKNIDIQISLVQNLQLSSANLFSISFILPFQCAVYQKFANLFEINILIVFQLVFSQKISKPDSTLKDN